MLIPLNTKNFKLHEKFINIQSLKINKSNRVYFMPIADKEDFKCYAFMCVVVLLILLATFYYQYIIRFVLLVVFYWYISIPLIIISISSIDFAIRKIAVRKAYNSINTVEFRESFRKVSGEEPFKKGKLTKSYKKWLIQKSAVPKYKVKSNFRFSPEDIKGFVLLIIFLIVVIAIFLAIYANIFPEYLLPIVW